MMDTTPKPYSYILFSTPEQEKGDSIRRQVELRDKYVREHGLTLDNSLRLTDRGLSDYKGLQRTKGALGIQAGELFELNLSEQSCRVRDEVKNQLIVPVDHFKIKE